MECAKTVNRITYYLVLHLDTLGQGPRAYLAACPGGALPCPAGLQTRPLRHRWSSWVATLSLNCHYQGIQVPCPPKVPCLARLRHCNLQGPALALHLS